MINHLLPKQDTGCPFLLLAPMEGVGDRTFRRAIGQVGGFDEAVADFLRVPTNAHVESLAKAYDPTEIHPLPLAVQLMGSDEELMAAMAVEVVKRGAHRIDLNCGCPSNTVTGRGAGSSLLKDPHLVYTVAKALVKAVSVPVTIKMRSGFEDLSLFEENLLAAQESGVAYMTLHPRTKVEGYGPPANWSLIRRAKELLKIPVVGNGDILSVEDAKRMLIETGCDGLMIGRGSVINPFIFHEIKADFAKKPYTTLWQERAQFVQTYFQSIPEGSSEKLQVNKLKQLMGFLFKANKKLLQMRQEMLTMQCGSASSFLESSLSLLQKGYTV